MYKTYFNFKVSTYNAHQSQLFFTNLGKNNCVTVHLTIYRSLKLLQHFKFLFIL